MKIAIVLVAALLTVGCNKSDKKPAPAPVVPEVGRFVDSAVEGVWYETETYSGFTGPNGEFNYELGEIVSFFLGTTLLGAAEASDIVTPLDLVAEGDHKDKVQNILSILQSLDADSDPDNGIVITQQTDEYISQFDINVNTPKELFAANDAVQAVIAAQTNSGQLVNAFDALTHFRETLLRESRVESENVVLDLMGTHWKSTLTTPDCGDIDLYQLSFTIIGPVSIGAHNYDSETCEPTRQAILGSTYELNKFWACSAECTNSDLNRVVETSNGAALLQYINDKLIISEEQEDGTSLTWTFERI